MLNIPINEQGWGLIVELMRDFARSEVGGRAIRWFVMLITLLLGINGLNIVNSYVGRDFMTAIAGRDMSAYLHQALLYVGVFAVSTGVAVWLRYTEERLGLLWRDWMTRRLLELYLQYPTYYRINDPLIKSSGFENPDQRIADDVRTFTTTTLSFALMGLNGVFTVAAFSGVLWSISPGLFVVAVAYALLGSYLTVVLGRPLVGLNYQQLDKEADFRSGLIHVRERAESIAQLHQEHRLLSRLGSRFDSVVGNFRKIIVVNRNLGYFTTGYNYLVQLIPILIVAPLFIQGDAEFGVITQSVMAFSMLIGAFSLIITQFQSISSYAAVIERLINLWYEIQLAQAETSSGTTYVEDNDKVAYEHLTIMSPTGGHQDLIRDLTVTIPHGTRVLITGTDERAQYALFKATLGILDTGTGKVIRPRLDRILFLPERPYLPPGTLREALDGGPGKGATSDEHILEILRSLGLESMLARVGWLDVERNWDSVLSIDEQRAVSFARVLLAAPRFVVLEHPSTEADPATTRQLMQMFTDRAITYLTIGRAGLRGEDERIENHDALLRLLPEGRWEWEIIAARPAARQSAQS
ncbi:ABC transporter ATP-binding protein/permease [Methylococcus sp. EFPC2]|uniref:ABC transporter ATP-binding protein/permease n=1 Tax=Methylococcus sp. EFPC2 TaxID=2812648 RepID=UPI001967DE35|nr:SbmA/BacA-like family transporter [Methylococcus sp. EFPC2]QSA98754.1 ABC transporter ATP-binding protein/permease [Methylococcus sp. EFPC2]